MKFFQLSTFILSLIVFFSAPLYAHGKEELKADINQMVELLEQYHPDPYVHIGKDNFYQKKNNLIHDFPQLTVNQIKVRMMKLISSIRDGHTVLFPSGENEFDNWFPLSFYKFSDGFYVVTADIRYSELIGKRIETINGVSPEKVFEKTADLLSSDNNSGRNWSTFYMSSGDALKALNIIENPKKIELVLREENGEALKKIVKAIEIPFDIDYRFWGEMFPNSRYREGNYVFGASKNPLIEFANRSQNGFNEDLPLHLQARRAYWYKYLPEHKAIYLHLTHITDAGRGSYESFEQFYKEVFRVAEENKVEKFILDQRYNSGGDGSVLIPFVHQFIRSDNINQYGKLFMITGRKTFSAGIMLMDLMLKHTKVLVVGEPAGAPRNSYGDNLTFYLKNSGMEFNISSVYWQLTSSADTAWEQRVDIPAVFSGENYFSGKDPAVDYILNLDGPYQSLPDMLIEKGGKITNEEYQKRKKMYDAYSLWWNPFQENLMRYAARELYDAGRKKDGIIGFQLLLDQYPKSWRAWRDFGKAYLSSNDKEKALECFQEGLKINPGYEYFREQVSKLQKEE